MSNGGRDDGPVVTPRRASPGPSPMRGSRSRWDDHEKHARWLPPRATADGLSSNRASRPTDPGRHAVHASPARGRPYPGCGAVVRTAGLAPPGQSILVGRRSLCAGGRVTDYRVPVICVGRLQRFGTMGWRSCRQALAGNHLAQGSPGRADSALRELNTRQGFHPGVIAVQHTRQCVTLLLHDSHPHE